MRLTARGAVAVMLVVALGGQLATELGNPKNYLWAGLSFTVSCLAAVVLVRRRDLLALVVTPPLVFFVATLAAQLAAAFTKDNPLQSLAAGLILSLSEGALWLFAGTALVLALAWLRGLPENVRDLKEELRGSRSYVEEPAYDRPPRSDRQAEDQWDGQPSRVRTARRSQPVHDDLPGSSATKGRALEEGFEDWDDLYAPGPRQEPPAREPSDQPRSPTRSTDAEADSAPRARRSRRAREPVDEDFAPEPEGYFEPRVYGKPRSEREQDDDY